ncbi:MAG: nucleoside-diphosphate kinase [Candidatus Marinimicrobia bacterium]|jgi:nucleoside-diphosphate kinase|nr:nucleoside-diphosphate kinase [Candidatus Neomarinimicrobiota bacterium]MBT3496741.1 nucleoside-diphosphate kinase [Candidatus Neomarinimicrobiota bacterium]MBT3692721.1 nucleoside-diphosphate kinase [Candidatus Neomarinimicrobiota bacterium]MBT3732875.1 nucleoside-diphosphate kinase [Candidatus Neomarinimicrobiota bacterium]MBT4144750.1 nucleoside-diphosphate kinase [Candidatus Neomarinimicrobiota bacterium]
MGNKTFAIIKPDAVKNGHTGKIYDRVLTAGFKILSAKLMKMTLAQAEGFYAVHKERPFFGELTTFMSSGACMVLALEKENAVAGWRKTIGATNPEEADEGTIRKDFATSLGENAVHGSDSDENAEKEIGFFFTESELISNQ